MANPWKVAGTSPQKTLDLLGGKAPWHIVNTKTGEVLPMSLAERDAAEATARRLNQRRVS